MRPCMPLFIPSLLEPTNPTLYPRITTRTSHGREAQLSKKTIHRDPLPPTLIQISLHDTFQRGESRPIMLGQCGDEFCERVSFLSRGIQGMEIWMGGLPFSVPLAVAFALSTSNKLEK